LATASIPAALAAASAAGSGIGATSILADVGMAASALGGVTGAIGAERSAAATGAMASYQAQVAAQNATLASQNAALAGAAGEAQVEQAGLKTKGQVGAIKAAQAASNIDVNTGSALDVRSSAAELGELNALTIRSNAAKTAYGYQTQQLQFTGQQQAYEAEAAQAPTTGALGAAASLLSGAAGVSSQYAQWQRVNGGPAQDFSGAGIMGAP
jgi:hypothetical protein